MDSSEVNIAGKTKVVINVVPGRRINCIWEQEFWRRRVRIPWVWERRTFCFGGHIENSPGQIKKS